MKYLARLLPIVLLVAPGSVWAEQGDLPYRTAGLYVGIGGGFSAIEMKSGEIRVDDDDLATKLTLGYRLEKDFSRLGINLAVEGAYLDLGSIEDRSLGADLDLEADGFSLHAVAYFPITRRWDIIGKAGVYAWDAELEIEGVEIDDDSGTDLAGGFGASFNTGTALGFRVEFESFDMLDGAWAATISGTYQFK